VGTYSSADLDLHTGGMLRGNFYVYLEDLLALVSCRPLTTATPEFVLDCEACSPLNQLEWTTLLAGHPDRSLVYIFRGIHNGFHIGFNRQHQLGTSPGNRSSSVSNIISDHLQRENRLDDPYIFPRNIHTSPIGIIPKKSKPGKWQLIVDLSSPDKKSVNNGMSSG